MSTGTCYDCRFLDGSTCRRYAPVIPPLGPGQRGKIMNAAWPRVLSRDWCGEHEKRNA